MNSLPKEIQETRGKEVHYPIHPLLLSRWSPRSMTGETLTDQDLMRLFEAARWAPSSYNAQPWCFHYAKRDTPSWESYLSLLVEFNQKWASKAGALIIVTSRKVFEHNQKPSITHSFDAGAAWAFLALQGAEMGLVVHGMQGFDYERAKKLCGLSEEYAVEAMIAVGKRGKKEALPEEMQKKELPSSRKPLSEIALKN